MCGIAGFTGAPDRPLLERMVESLVHRGPDEAGYWQGDDVALGMRRLAIIDVATGHQPVWNETEDIATVFNGEIYNYVELRAELEARGHKFRTHHSDTEVIVHLYEDFGLDFVHHLNGMFAIALWDKRSRQLVLVRDRAGIKPLYYTMVGGNIAFGSEPKALLVRPDVSREPDLVALHHYFSLKNVPAPRSAFQAIRQLRPGELAVWRDGGLECRRWWRIAFNEQADVDPQAATAAIRGLLEDSVRLQMRSDVPYGAYLSGGVDSSSVVALMSRAASQPVKTFTLVYEDGFRNKDADREHAASVAEMYGTEHHEHVVRFADVPASIDRIIGSFDEPFSGVISTFFVTDLISRHVKVALSGDGADELFASYRPHRLAEPLALYRRLQARLSNLEPDELDRLGEFRDKLDTLSSIAGRGDEAAARMEQYLADDAQKFQFYSPKMQAAAKVEQTEDLLRRLYAEAGTTDPLNRALFIDFEFLLPDQVLAFVDRLSMAHSVEVRPPFLDHRLIELAATLPGRVKIKDGRVKNILKDAVRDLLPAGVLDRPKEGFLMPINEWILKHYRGLLEATLAPAQLARHGLFRPEAIRAMIEDHYAGRRRLGDRLWNIFMFQLWWEKYYPA